MWHYKQEAKPEKVQTPLFSSPTMKGWSSWGLGLDLLRHEIHLTIKEALNKNSYSFLGLRTRGGWEEKPRNGKVLDIDLKWRKCTSTSIKSFQQSHLRKDSVESPLERIFGMKTPRLEMHVCVRGRWTRDSESSFRDNAVTVHQVWGTGDSFLCIRPVM